MHSKSSSTNWRLIMLALASAPAIVVALAFDLPKSGAAPVVQGKTSPGAMAPSRGVGSRHDSKVQAFLAQPSVRSSLDEVKLTDPGGQEIDRAGWTVAISGKTAVVGTVERKVHIFIRRDDVWELQQTLPVDPRLPNGEDHAAGFPLAIDGSTLVIGAYAAAYVYVRTGTTWSLQTTLLSPVPGGPPTNGGSFGSSVAVSGDTVIVGASGVDDGAGAVYFYERSGTTWSGPLKVSANDHSPNVFGDPGDAFGRNVAIEQDTAVVTAPGQDVVADNFLHQEGAAYVYVRSGGGWIEQGYLIPDDDNIDATFQMGTAVDLSGDTAVIGAQLSDRAFVFVRQGTSWTEQQVLTAFDGLTGDQFGGVVGISGDKIVVGAAENDDALGAAYVYERTGATWFEGDKLRATTGVPTEGSLLFGNGVGISGDTIIVGAPDEEVGLNRLQGAAYIFQQRDTDKDGLPDDWEQNGVTVDGVFIDLPKMGASAMHKDIFVHLDWMSPDPSGKHFEPNPRAIKEVIDSFAVAPVDNPDSKPGINLHVDLGPASIMKYVEGASETWGELSRAGEVPFQAVIEGVSKVPPYNWPTVDAVKMARFKPAKRNVIFHYALYCNSYREPGDPPEKERRGGVSRGAPGTDFLLAIGSRPPNGEPIREASLFMHEFGHNLGLLHGGGDDVNDKPNYISIMNYRFELIGTLHPNGRQRYIDYSRATLGPLNENNLSENVGINDPVMHLTTWNPRTRPDTPPGSNKCLQNPDFYYRLFYPGNALDWDCDGTRSFNPVTADINGDGELGLLTGFDDWPVLVFDAGGRIGNRESAAANRIDSTGVNKSERASASQPDTLPDELTIEELEALVPPALLNEELVAPLDVVTLSLHTGAPPLPVYFDGSASTAVSGTIVDWQWDFGDGTTGSGATVTHIYTALGDYYATLTVTDSNGHVNLVPLLNRVTVTDHRPNLTPFQPPAWAGKIVVSTVTGTNTDSLVLTTNNILYIDSAVINNGTGPTTGTFVTKLYVDGVEAQTFLTSPPLNTNSFTAGQDVAIGPLSAGQHTLTVVADVNGTIVETDELDNEYSRVISISSTGPTPSPTPTGQPNLTPYQPPGWSDKIVVSNVTGTNADSATLNTTDTLYVDWAAINNGGGPTTGSFETKLYVDGVEKNTRVTSISINPGGSFGVQDLTIGSLSAGQHTVSILLDSGGVITESNEADNEYIKVINVASPPIATNFAVTTTDDNGNDTTPTPGSLRQAILNANGSPNPVGKIDVITFNMPGAGVKTIQPPIRLPRITDPVIIDGYTQPGASANTIPVGNNAVLLIELDIESVVPGGGGFAFGLDLRGTGGSTVRGLVINRFQSGGMFISSGNNVVEGCFIGSNVAGDSALPYNFPDNNHNSIYGIFINQGASNRIGGTSPAARNVIAPVDGAIVIGNPLSGPTTDTLVQGNYIGTNAAGTATLNAGLTSGYGVAIAGASNTTIGGTQPGAGNVISGNGVVGSGFGISISSATTTIGDVTIQGNLIGTNAQGTAAIRNADGGIYADGTINRLVIGGSQNGARNIISGNGVDRVSGREVLCAGIALYANVQNGATVQGNFIGTGSDGVTLIPNRVDGIGIAPVPNKSYTIGGVNPGEGNTIAGNARHGIQVVALPDGSAGTVAILGNSIFSNGGLSIFGNGGLGIDLQGYPENSFNVTRNDNCDGDSGPNGLQNFPNLTAATASTSITSITGSLNSKAATAFRIEFFSNAACDGSGQGEGQAFIGSTMVTTDGSCNANINVALPGSVPVGRFITATATDPNGNTSEFGPCVQVTQATPTAADSSISGQISDAYGNSIAGVAISLNGTQNRLTMTDGNGRYNFDNVETNGFYTIVPTRANYLFSPAQRSFSALGSHTDAGFTATSTNGGLNPLDSTEYFVRQQYLDFLGREPDESGFNFWTNQIRACGDDARCLEDRRVNTSAAFFLSIEFQRTGYLVYRTYKCAYGDLPDAPVPLKLDEFLADTRMIGQNVVVNQAGWEEVLENNSALFMLDFVQRARFRAALPTSLTPAEFVDRLFNRAGVTPTGVERAVAIAEFDSAMTTHEMSARARTLRRVAENSTLAGRELNRAFVLMQYFGYLRRNPVDPPEPSLDYGGYNFWLSKLSRFDGNSVNAEMVRAFLVSGEYRRRFGL